MKCSSCGEEHELLEPGFRRPDAVVMLPDDERAQRVKESDDACAIRALTRSEPDRYFIRATLEVPLLDVPEPTHWGVWVEIGETAFSRVMELWSDPEQANEPPIEAKMANSVRGYADTVGLPMTLQLTGPTTRPAALFQGDSLHTFVTECRGGVTLHRVHEWLHALP